MSEPLTLEEEFDCTPLSDLKPPDPPPLPDEVVARIRKGLEDVEHQELSKLLAGKWMDTNYQTTRDAFEVLAGVVLILAGVDVDHALRFLWHETELQKFEGIFQVSERYYDPDWVRDRLVEIVQERLGKGTAGGTRPLDVIEQWRRQGPLIHEPTGIVELDNLTGGGPVYGSRWYLAGAPDAGKTALAVQFADEFARRGVPVGILAVDEEPSDILMRFAQRRVFTREQCERRDPEVLDAIEKLLALLPLNLYSAEWTIEEAAADLAGKAGRPGVLVIDSVQAATSDAEKKATYGGSRYEVITARVGAVRTVAEKHGLLVIATSEMGRAFYRNAAAAADLDDLAAGKESGAIEFSARVLLSLRSVKDEPNLIELKLPKNKHGPRTAVDENGLFLRLDRARQCLKLTRSYDPPAPGARKAKQSREQNVQDAAHVAAVVAASPGITNRELRAAARVRAGSMSSPRFDTALSLLGEAVVQRPGKRTAINYYLDGQKVSPDILKRLPENERGNIIFNTPRPSEPS